MTPRSVAARLHRSVRRLRQPPRAPQPPRPQYRYVVVVTYGRSGSTLVQGLLNTLPRTLVRGENSLYVLPLFRAMAQVQSFGEAHRNHHPRRAESAFFGLHEIKPRSFIRSTHQLVTDHLLGSTPPHDVDVLGFKEVLWHLVSPDETEAFFLFLDQVLPGCQYVLNQREPAQVTGSGFWQAHDKDQVLDAVRRVQDIQAYLRETRPERVLDLHYELVTSEDTATSDAQLRALAEFVHGSCDDALMAQMRETLKTGHGPYPFGQSRGRGARQGGRPAAVDRPADARAADDNQ